MHCSTVRVYWSLAPRESWQNRTLRTYNVVKLLHVYWFLKCWIKSENYKKLFGTDIRDFLRFSSVLLIHHSFSYDLFFSSPNISQRYINVTFQRCLEKQKSFLYRQAYSPYQLNVKFQMFCKKKKNQLY